MFLELIIYFFAGILQDFVLTLNWRYVAKDKILPAVIFSFLATIIYMIALYNILTKLDSERTMLAIIIYALGISVGTYLGMIFKPGLRNHKK